MKTFWVVVISFVLTAVVIGGGTYYMVNAQATTDKNSLQAQITDLNIKVAATEKSLSDTQAAASAITSPAATSTTADATANWKTYTNPTFGYSIKYPTTWTVKQSNVLADGVTESVKNMSIEFNSGTTQKMTIWTEYKTKVGDPSLATLAAEKTAPIDKTTISGAISFKIGSLDGYRRLVTITDPVSNGLQYITKDSKYIYHLTTSETTASTEITEMLTTFIAS